MAIVPESTEWSIDFNSLPVWRLRSPPPVLWESDRVKVWVHFDDAGLVTDYECFPRFRRTDESPLDMLRRWLGL